MGDGNSQVETGKQNSIGAMPDWLNDTFNDLPTWLTENPDKNPIEEFRNRLNNKLPPESEDQQKLYNLASRMYDLIANPISPNSENPPAEQTNIYNERIKSLRSITRSNNQPIDSQLFDQAVDIVRPFYLEQFKFDQKVFKSNFLDTIIEDIRPIQKPTSTDTDTINSTLKQLQRRAESGLNSQAAGGTE